MNVAPNEFYLYSNSSFRIWGIRVGKRKTVSKSYFDVFPDLDFLTKYYHPSPIVGLIMYLAFILWS